jgi:O-acetylhomoserine (thiol)-lyase
VRDETIAIHGGYEADSTRAVAVPIYQTVAHDFIDAEHAGAIFDLESPGFHYNRINNPTTDVLEKRITALEGGTGAMAVSSGAAAIRVALRNLSTVGCNIVSAPQLYGATYTLFAYMLPEEGV